MTKVGVEFNIYRIYIKNLSVFTITSNGSAEWMIFYKRVRFEKSIMYETVYYKNNFSTHRVDAISERGTDEIFSMRDRNGHGGGRASIFCVS